MIEISQNIQHQEEAELETAQKTTTYFVNSEEQKTAEHKLAVRSILEDRLQAG